MKKASGIILHCVLTLFFILFFLWGGLALWYHLPFGRAVSVAAVLAWAFLAFAVTEAEWSGPRAGSRLLALAFCAAMMVWWSTIHPSLHRDWRPELARTVVGKVEGSRAYLKNIRNFSWQTPDRGTARWLDAVYDLETITGVSVYLSYWMGPLIAHTLVGFHFADGRELVFSAEIRRMRGERFSSLKGFFKGFELAMIAALPGDIIRLRTDVRQENVFRYRLDADPEKVRALFELYVDRASSLARDPEFYNTLTTNCTTVIFDMMRLIDPGMRPDWRMLLSGKLPSYFYDHGLVDTSVPLREVVARAYLDSGRPAPSRLLP